MAATALALDVSLYRRLLVGKRAELMSQLRNRPDALARTGRAMHDDHARLAHDEAIRIRMGTLHSEQLRQVDVALERIASGNYGICIDCEEPIAEKRLRAIPWAARCLACQEKSNPPPPVAVRRAA